MTNENGKSISVTAYEIFTVLARLKARGTQKVNFYDLNRAVNKQRLREGRKGKLSPQTMHYHLTNHLIKQPFFGKAVHERNASYFLINGLYKLTQHNPPICLNVSETTVHAVMSCEHIKTCKDATFSKSCIEKLSQ